MRSLLTCLMFGTLGGFAAVASAADQPATLPDQLRTLFASQSQVTVSAVGPLTVLEGEVDDLAQLAKVAAVVDSLQDSKVPVRSLVRLSPATGAAVAEQIQQAVASPGVRVRFMNGSYLIEGIVASEYEADRAVVIAKTLLAAPTQPGVRRVASGSQMLDGPSASAFVILDFLRIKPIKGSIGSIPPRSERAAR